MEHFGIVLGTITVLGFLVQQCQKSLTGYLSLYSIPVKAIIFFLDSRYRIYVLIIKIISRYILYIEERLIQMVKEGFPKLHKVLMVGLDISKKHPKEIWIGFELNGYQHKVEFESLPIFCSYYKKYGHCNSECFNLHPHLYKHKEISKEAKGENIIRN
ncbi:hypothetical protein IEQ34_022934 [Dendrobium chrysotoxum]|uniref:Uncharacterized protein n=1 Tax=Dendrobium chrysotoxum TaxID=161865 RepID=A0AAV7G0B7_DENCH|nr:hypothetical protein IEQ34_022934 [Dendrobium chrysotoxum]